MSTVVNPTFRLDVTGKLFLDKETNINIQDTITFNSLFTRLSINKGDLAVFPGLGLKQYFNLFNFNNSEDDLTENIRAFEKDATDQLGKKCTITYSLDRDNGNTDMSFNIEGLSYGINFEYKDTNKSIDVINYSFNDD